MTNCQFPDGPMCRHNRIYKTIDVSEEISSRGAKDAIREAYEMGGNPKTILEGKKQKSDTGELSKIVEEILKENPKVVEEYKAGKEEVLQFFVGQGMQKTKGAANPQILQGLFKEHLG